MQPIGVVDVNALKTLSFADIQPLLCEGLVQGYRFVDRLVTEYENGTNRFALPGEALYGVYRDDRMIAVGGLNRDPFLGNDAVGRVRHVYVLSGFCRRGVGTLLLRKIIDEARQYFHLLTLRTFSDDAAKFYVAMGFQPTSEIPNATHMLSLDVPSDAVGL